MLAQAPGREKEHLVRGRAALPFLVQGWVGLAGVNLETTPHGNLFKLQIRRNVLISLLTFSVYFGKISWTCRSCLIARLHLMLNIYF